MKVENDVILEYGGRRGGQDEISQGDDSALDETKLRNVRGTSFGVPTHR